MVMAAVCICTRRQVLIDMFVLPTRVLVVFLLVYVLVVVLVYIHVQCIFNYMCTHLSYVYGHHSDCLQLKFRPQLSTSHSLLQIVSGQPMLTLFHLEKNICSNQIQVNNPNYYQLLCRRVYRGDGGGRCEEGTLEFENKNNKNSQGL